VALYATTNQTGKVVSETIRKTSDNGWMPYLRAAPGEPQPWSRRLTWTASLWALAVAVFVTLMWGIPHIESRLDQHSRMQLQQAGVDASTLNLRWSYRDVSIYGELPQGVSAEQLEQIMRRGDEQTPAATPGLFARGIRNIEVFAEPADSGDMEVASTVGVQESASVLMPEAKTGITGNSLTVDINLQNNSAIVEGVVESAGQRQSLVNALLGTGVENIQDNLEVLDIAEETSAAKLSVLTNMLDASSVEHVSLFTASLDQSRLQYRVNTSDKANANLIESAATAAILDFNISGQTTVAQTGVVDVTVNSDGTSLTMQGNVLTDEQRRRLSFAAHEAAGLNVSVVDRVTVSDQAAGTPGSDSRVDGLAEIIAQFKPGVSGQINLHGSELTFDAAVASDQIKNSLQEVAASARGRGIMVTERITVHDNSSSPGPEISMHTLQGELDSLAPTVRENVVFNSGTARLTSDAEQTLNRIVEVLQRYPSMKVEVEGHTDNVGREAVNEQLSIDRAESVRQYLVSQSIDASRLIAVGYGSRLPLVDNDTSEGRKRNRRVHFNVPDQQITE
jgi:outer membrane protein OmpA-like peptidoglycan-associated protein